MFALAGLLSPGEALADPNDYDYSVGVFAGGNVFTHEIELGNAFYPDQVPGSGLLLGGRFSYVLVSHFVSDSTIDPRMSIEFEGKMLFSWTEGTEMRPSEFSPIFGWRGNILFDFWRQRKLSPFVLVGIGGETLIGDSKYMESPDTDVVGYLGFGGQYRLAANYGLRLDFRTGIIAGRDAKSAAIIEAHAGMYYRFGTGSISIATTLGVSEPVAQPDADEDGDGLVDEEDKCPTEAETKNGIDDDDGCPEMDDDKDGILGSADKCPSQMEDMDSFEDEDGCPDLDNDDDKVSDVADKCPGEAENRNGFRDEDGCPDEIPDALKLLEGTVKAIAFPKGSAQFYFRARPTLNKIALLLKEHPSLRVEISGHTDNRGSEKINLRISQKRADSTKKYLVSKGVDESRIETIGLGSSKNTNGNATVRQRAANRRIDFKIIVPEANQEPTTSGEEESTRTPEATQPESPPQPAPPAAATELL